MRPIHTSSSAGHALGVDAHQHVNAVPGPRCYLGWRNAGVEPPCDAGVAQVVGALHIAVWRAGPGGGRERGPSARPATRWTAGSGSGFRCGTACRPGRAELGDMRRSRVTSSGGIGTLRAGLRARRALGLPLVRPLRPRCSWTCAVVGVGLARRRGWRRRRSGGPSLFRAGGSRPGEGGDLGGAHHRVEHAAVEGDEPRPLAAADGSRRLRASRRRAPGCRPRAGRWHRPGLAGASSSSGRLALLSGFFPAASCVPRSRGRGAGPGGAARSIGGRRAPVEVDRQGVEHIADHGGVLERADGPGGLLDPARWPSPASARRAPPRGRPG